MPSMCRLQYERDLIENIAATKITQTNFSISNALWENRHPSAIRCHDPANFSFTYSHQHQYTGETTMYMSERINPRGALIYSAEPGL